MREDREKAIQLRKDGLSYKDISRQLKIPRSTLSAWFSSEPWSQAIRSKLSKESVAVNTARILQLDKVRGEKLAQKYNQAREEARSELAILKRNPLFITGVMLYWGEGDKTTRHLVRLVNCEFEMIRLYVLFLKKICNVPAEKIRASLHIYPDLDDGKCRRYWSNRVDVPLQNFTKSIRLQGKGARRNTHGMCTIVISSTYFKCKVLEWIRLLPKELML